MQDGVKTNVLLVRTLKTVEFSIRTDQSRIITSEGDIYVCSVKAPRSRVLLLRQCHWAVHEWGF